MGADRCSTAKLRPVVEEEARRRVAGAGRRLLGPAARLSAWTSLAAITALSLVPGVLRPSTFLPSRAEHFAAYAAAGLFFVMGYPSLRQRILAWSGVAAASIVFEILQNFIPGRSPSTLDALASISGVTVGLVFGAVADAILFGNGRPGKSTNTLRP